ncbi:hypothetical protein [Pontimicrobium aquaticum]|uniref:Phage abortive infection protein n=1 Tax=Pontimicrobium aquaticum TaxID=2565367 RepID=A0A4V5LR51_9FLAO|nr:hypothetical protein [Pontimicrobium aquaticum]TJY37929.1 hypothetical protein E5167_01345 [Pontimicrobium aquaticum]
MKKPLNKKTSILLLIGIILMLITSVYMFTRPAIWNGFDFTQTGQIGDTIGGITAPIINLLGAILVYLSFQAQIKANRIQFELLNQDIINQGLSSNFKVALELFKELKLDLLNLNFGHAKGQGALNAYANAIKDNWSKTQIVHHINEPIYQNWKFIMAEYDLLITHLSSDNFIQEEKEKILILVKNYYSTQLDYGTNRITKALIKHGIENDIVAIFIKFKDFHSVD